ncbi:hypothetical protein BDV95DRAFT_589514 [Massariosphaeria phaeospora]|uniref:BTB domain-containing protein n=1 Tax=Massariosphaeria phaeospora TaxID=100035 RepID=A0A7C8MWD2_9PLEO|nr:hypothetical protein BDV95DRAFT_589514 [Massariosphaeria phaeospora]
MSDTAMSDADGAYPLLDASSNSSSGSKSPRTQDETEPTVDTATPEGIAPADEEPSPEVMPSSEPSSSSSPSFSTVGPPTPDAESDIIDPNGDLHFSVTTKEGVPVASWLVNSGCVRRASPTWEKLICRLYPTESGRLELEIVEDARYKAVFVWLLHAAHMDTSRLPRDVSFPQLVRIAQITLRHRVLRVFLPFLRQWTFPWLSKLGQPGYELWLLVAYAFGHLDVFATMCTTLALQMEPLTEGYRIGDLETSGSEIEGVLLNHLVRIREQHIADTIAKCYELVERFSVERAACQHPTTCISSALGSLLRSMKACGLWPSRPNVEDIQVAANDLRLNLSRRRVSGFRGHDVDSCTRSSFLLDIFCSPNIPAMEYDKEIAEHLESTRTIVTDQLLAWEHYGTASMGFKERDFYVWVSVDSDSEYESEEDPEQPPEEYLSCEPWDLEDEEKDLEYLSDA